MKPRDRCCKTPLKAHYWTRFEAERCARRLEWVEGLALTAYDCPYCDFWHLTTNRMQRLGDLEMAFMAQESADYYASVDASASQIDRRVSS